MPFNVLPPNKIGDIHNPWRDSYNQLPPDVANFGNASYRGIPFYVEIVAKGSGRRSVLHEFPKRDTPYAEDLGRRAYQFTIVGYLIGPIYQTFRDSLENALESNTTPGELVLPLRVQRYLVTCVQYVISERRIWGGYAEVEMTFVESGVAPGAQATNTQAQIAATSAAAAAAAQQQLIQNNNAFSTQPTFATIPPP